MFGLVGSTTKFSHLKHNEMKICTVMQKNVWFKNCNALYANALSKSLLLNFIWCACVHARVSENNILMVFHINFKQLGTLSFFYSYSNYNISFMQQR